MKTHDVTNQVPPLLDFDAWVSDPALREAVAREGAAWAEAELAAFGKVTQVDPPLHQGGMRHGQLQQDLLCFRQLPGGAQFGNRLLVEKLFARQQRSGYQHQQ